MAVDLEAIARNGRCDVSSLRIALPLLEQGYSPPFLARYRRDELSGLDESTLWTLAASVHAEQAIASRKEGLIEQWNATALVDPSIGHAIRKASSRRVLGRLTRRLKQESGEPAPSDKLAVRLLNPQKGDGDELPSIAAKIEGLDADAAIAGLENSVADRLVGDPRVIAAAIRWLSKNARIHIANISDPHTQKAAEEKQAQQEKQAKEKKEKEAAETPAATQAAPDTASQATATDETKAPEAAAEPSAPAQETPASENTAPVPNETEAPAAETPTENAASPEAQKPTTQEPAVESPTPPATAEPDEAKPAETPVNPEAATKPDTAKPDAGKPDAGKPAQKQEPAKTKKISPRQRRRRWLVSVLKPLSGKRLSSNKLSAFQIVMLGRALRSQVAECSFEYDAAKLVGELQRVVSGFNRPLESKLNEWVLEHEANIREAAEAAWWDEMHERASVRLIGIAADNLRRQINRGSVDAKTVMSIDAVGPRTAATAIVSADGRVLHCEDLPCQLSTAQRSQAVAKMGELIHAHHVDLIIISNGPSRRACMIALGELISQSPDSTLRWTLADRSGADVYAGSDVAGQEMRSTPRRFRSAAWLAFSVLQPAHAIVKVDPLKLRLASFQRELSDDAMADILGDVMVSGASRGGVDVNRASVATLARLPGMSDSIAQSIDQVRRKSLIGSRDELLGVDGWTSVSESRQALPFLRVFGSDEAMDGTLIHPDDYPLAKKLAGALDIELPPASPPGYIPPQYADEESAAAKTDTSATDAPGLKEATPAAASPVVEDLSAKVHPENESFGAEQPADAPANEETSPSQTEDPAAQTEEPAESKEPAADAANEEKSEDSAASEPAAESTAEETPDSTEPSETAETPGQESSEPAETTAEAPAAPPAESLKRPLPDRAKIEKCIKEWQVGPNRVNQLVNWLCDPFGDSDKTGEAPAVLTMMPTQGTLKAGDQVIGVVVGVMPFGVFVEIAPDCSGLIHVSKVTDKFVEDLHEVIQVGDVVTAWVTGIDTKKRRVALSAISPEREAEIAKERSERSRSGGRDNQNRRRGGGQGAGQNRGGQSRGGQSGGTGARGSSGKPGGAPARGGQGGRGKPGGGRGGSGRSGGRGDSRGRDSRGRRDRKPESYNVVSKKEKTKITDAMQKGDEPLRSFGDLMQFYGKDESKKKDDSKKQGKPKKDQPAAEPKAESKPAEPKEAASDVTAKSDSPQETKPQTNVVIDESSTIKPPVSSQDPATPPQVDPSSVAKVTDSTDKPSTGAATDE